MIIKRDKEILDYVFSLECSAEYRKEYFRHDFLSFCLYYFPGIFSHWPAQIQREYCDDLQSWVNIFFVWFRECAKTLYLKYYYIWMIVYEKRHYLMHYNSDKKKAEKFLFSLSMILQKNTRLTDDFGFLYHEAEWRKKTDMTKKTLWAFMIWEAILVEAMSIWTSPRWATFTAIVNWLMREFRVDFVSMDDIDNDKNIWNPKIIETDVSFIKWEVSGWTSAFCQKVYLWNVLTEDTRVMRLKKHYSNNPDFKLYWIPIRQKWKIVWDRFVATDKEAEEKNKKIRKHFEAIWEPIDDTFFYVSLESKRRDQGSIAYNQNFNLIAYKKWQRIIKDSDIKYYYNLPKNHKIIFWIDPAFSEKTWSDGMWLTITAHEKFETVTYKYVIEMMEFLEDEKDEEKFCNTVANLYHKYKCSLIYIENNNGGWIIWRMLKKRRLAVIVKNSEKDKVTRLREFQWEFERWLIKFNPDDSKVASGIEQLKKFPNVDHDDMVDSMVYSFYPFVGWNIRSF